ncbi:MAG: hypothetical protein V3U75_07920 [Methylococcaceae bacterium]
MQPSILPSTTRQRLQPSNQVTQPLGISTDPGVSGIDPEHDNKTPVRQMMTKRIVFML